MGKLRALLIVGFTGIAITGLEIAAARLVAPFFGSTIYVWGGAIGTVLFGLSVGYWLGGKVIDRKPSAQSVRVTLGVAGISSLIIPWWYQWLGVALTNASTSWHIPVGLGVIVMMGLLFFIPIVSLGMISPMILRLAITDIQSAGSISGMLSGAATLGSLLGTFGSAYWTVPVFGTRMTILGSATLILLIAWLAAWPIKVRKGTSLASIVLLFVSISLSLTTPVVGREGLQWERESAYQLVQVLTHNRTRYLVHDAGFGIQSLYTPGVAYTNSAYDVFGVLPLLAAEHQPQRVLIIGLGGGSMVRLYEQGVENGQQLDITTVELDQTVIDAAQQWFDLNQLHLSIVHDDARHYLRTTHDSYDIIIIDAYTHEMQIPPMLATQEFFEQVADHLAPGGVVGMNALAFNESRYLPKLLTTIASVFPDTREAPFAVGSLNHIIIAGDQLDFSRADQSLGSTLDALRDQLLPRLKSVDGRGDVYTDDRTDLDIRVKPLLQ